MLNSTIAIIGAGRVGTTTAYALMLKNLVSKLLIVDIDTARCKGEVLDLEDVLPFCATSQIEKATFSEAAQADIIIITAGLAQKPGQMRMELMQANLKIMESIASQLKPLNDKAIIIMVSNPLDILTHALITKKILPKKQIFGAGTFLDSMRLRESIGAKLNIAPESIQAFVLGEHGETQFPAWSISRVDGKLIASLFDENELLEFEKKTRQKGYDILNAKGSTYYGIATCVAQLVQSILFDERKIFPVSSFHDELGVCLSLPCIVGKNGIEDIFSIDLNNVEKEQLNKSAQYLASMVDFE